MGFVHRIARRGHAYRPADRKPGRVVYNRAYIAPDDPDDTVDRGLLDEHPETGPNGDAATVDSGPARGVRVRGGGRDLLVSDVYPDCDSDPYALGDLRCRE